MAINNRTPAMPWDQTLLRVSDFVPLSLDGSAPVCADMLQGEPATYKLRFASNSSRRWIASMLVEKMYGSRGYKTEHNRQQQTPLNIGLLVFGNDHAPVGTLSVGIGGPEKLLADEIYGAELDALRQQGWKLVEFGKFAIDRKYSGGSKRVMSALFNVAYLYTLALEHDYIVLEVHPRHAGFYQRQLGMESIGPERVCSRVGAPSVLMGLSCVYVAEKLRQLAIGHTEAGAERMLYRYFLNPPEQAEMVARLRETANTHHHMF